MTSLGNQSALSAGPGGDFDKPAGLGSAAGPLISIALPSPDNSQSDTPLFRFAFAQDNKLAPEQDEFIIQLRTIDQQYQTEEWLVTGPVRSGLEDGLAYATSPHYLVAHLIYPEQDLDDTEQAVETAYRKLMSFCAAKGFGHLVRTWNFMPCINQGGDQQERYRRFSVGRAHAFDAAGLREEQLPAGTAIGTPAGTDLCVTVLAARAPLQMVNNSRQVDAFRYPPQYGPRSPSFSRAVLIPDETSQCLLVSGTASVVGHESLHAGDVAAQMEETCANIAHLVGDAQRTGNIPDSRAPRGVFRVYLRRPEDLDIVRSIHEAHFPGAPTLYLQGDICREELLIETEAALWL